MKILYRILLNEAKDPEGRHIAPCDGYKPEHPLIQSYSEIEKFERDPEGICELLFERFNIDHPSNYCNRSLCVGDVIVLEFDHNTCLAYSVERFGFKQIEVPVGHSSLTAVL
jgi:hypothetical protein